MKILKGFLLFVGGLISILFIIGMIVGEEEVESSSADFVVEDQAAAEDYVETVREKSLRTKRELVGKAYEVKDILNEEYKDYGYFDYNSEENIFFMTITDQDIIEFSKTVSEADYDDDISVAWKANISEKIVKLSESVSKEMGKPTDIVVKTPWEYDLEDDDSIWSLIVASDGKLISTFGDYSRGK